MRMPKKSMTSSQNIMFAQLNHGLVYRRITHVEAFVHEMRAGVRRDKLIEETFLLSPVVAGQALHGHGDWPDIPGWRMREPMARAKVLRNSRKILGAEQGAAGCQIQRVVGIAESQVWGRMRWVRCCRP